MMDDKIYVCEWVKKDISFIENDAEFSLLQNYDYTYHLSFEQAKNISELKWKGYSLAKGTIDSSDEYIEQKPFHEKIHCECIWIYEDNYAIGRYVMQSGRWIYDAYSEKWQKDWIEMLTIPVPLIE